MSRSGYHYGSGSEMALYRACVERSIKGKRGQAFLRDLAEAMDAMPVKRLIAGELISESGEMCTIGVVVKARAIPSARLDMVDETEPEQVGELVGIAPSLAAEIEYLNDERLATFTPEVRWQEMRAWVQAKIEGKPVFVQLGYANEEGPSGDL